MASRSAKLADAFRCFSKDGSPLDATGIIPIGRVVRGALWVDANAEKFLGRMDADGDGKVNMLDFVAFFHQKLEAANDEEFDGAVNALEAAAAPATEGSEAGGDDGEDPRVIDSDPSSRGLGELVDACKENPLPCGAAGLVYAAFTASFGAAWLLYSLAFAILSGYHRYATELRGVEFGSETVGGVLIVNAAVSVAWFGLAPATITAVTAGAFYYLVGFLDLGSLAPPPPPPKQPRGPRSKKGVTKGKGGAKTSNKAKKNKAETKPTPAPSSSAPLNSEQSAAWETHPTEEEEDVEEEEEASEEEEEEEEDDDYDLALLMGNNKKNAKVRAAPKGSRRSGFVSRSSTRDRVGDERYAVENQYVEGGHEHQDWGNVVWGSRNANAAPSKSRVVRSAQELNSAMRTGNIEQVKKVKVSGPTNFFLLDNADEAVNLNRVGLTLSKRIQQARASRNMKQAELAKAINEKPAVVNEYETGKAIPNHQILGKMERVLGVKLRGKI